jgi:predicted PhzF superfamily epimerase YddE/YHI9
VNLAKRGRHQDVKFTDVGEPTIVIEDFNETALKACQPDCSPWAEIVSGGDPGEVTVAESTTPAEHRSLSNPLSFNSRARRSRG